MPTAITIYHQGETSYGMVLITRLVLSDNQLDNLPAKLGGGNPALELLKQVDVRNNLLTECGEALWDLPALKVLILTGNPLSDPYMLGVPDDGATSSVIELDLCE